MFNFTQISNRRIGKITLDVVTTEEHTSELSITDNPIESGAEIADHAVVKPKQVTIVGVVVDHDHDGAGLNIPGVGNIRGVSDFLNGLPLPAKVISQTQQTIAKATRVASQVQGAIDTAKQTVNKVRSIAPFLPDFGLGGLLDSSDANGRVQKCYADLVSSQKSGETIEIQTGLLLYKNMMIESISVRQIKDGSAEFTITAREVFIVDTTTVSKGKSSVAGKKKSGRAGVQSAAKTQQGTTQPSVPKESSLLDRFANGVIKAFS